MKCSHWPACITVLYVLLVSTTHGHMEMVHPPPIKSKYNPHYDYDSIDYSYSNPLGDYPCKGYHIGEPPISTAQYDVGVEQIMTIKGVADHGGGSCQIALSYDAGETFIVIKSIVGGCPLNTNYTFTVPYSAPHGQALLSWTWISRLGNRDFYQNCAWVDISNPVAERYGNMMELAGPELFVAQIPGACTVEEGYDFIYPDPGLDVEFRGTSDNYTIICEDCYDLNEKSREEGNKAQQHTVSQKTCIIHI
jgi:hypothetical protein